MRYVILHLDAYPAARRLDVLNGLAQHKGDLLPVRDFGDDLVFELMRGQEAEPARTQPEQRIPVSGRPTSLFDSDTAVSWRGPENEAPIEVSVGPGWRVSGLRLHYGANPRLPATSIEVVAVGAESEPNPAWKTAADWPALAELALSLMASPEDGTQIVRFTAVAADRFRVRLLGRGSAVEVTEMELLGARGPN